MNYSELSQRILDRYSVDELVDVLGIRVEDILEHFEEEILDKLEELDV